MSLKILLAAGLMERGDEKNYSFKEINYLLDLIKTMNMDGLEVRVQTINDLKAIPDLVKTDVRLDAHFTHNLAKELSQNEVSPKVFRPYNGFIAHPDVYKVIRNKVPKPVIKRTYIENTMDKDGTIPEVMQLVKKYRAAGIAFDISHWIMSISYKNDKLSRYLKGIRRFNKKDIDQILEEISINDDVIKKVGKKVKHMHISGIKTEEGKIIHHVPLCRGSSELNEINAMKLEVIKGIVSYADDLKSITIELRKDYLNKRNLGKTLVYTEDMIFKDQLYD